MRERKRATARARRPPKNGCWMRGRTGVEPRHPRSFRKSCAPASSTTRTRDRDATSSGMPMFEIPHARRADGRDFDGDIFGKMGGRTKTRRLPSRELPRFPPTRNRQMLDSDQWLEAISAVENNGIVFLTIDKIWCATRTGGDVSREGAARPAALEKAPPSRLSTARSRPIISCSAASGAFHIKTPTCCWSCRAACRFGSSVSADTRRHATHPDRAGSIADQAICRAAADQASRLTYRR